MRGVTLAPPVSYRPNPFTRQEVLTARKLAEQAEALEQLRTSLKGSGNFVSDEFERPVRSSAPLTLLSRPVKGINLKTKTLKNKPTRCKYCPALNVPDAHGIPHIAVCPGTAQLDARLDKRKSPETQWPQPAKKNRAHA